MGKAVVTLGRRRPGSDCIAAMTGTIASGRAVGLPHHGREVRL